MSWQCVCVKKINSELERLESFGGIEEVFFTEFVFQ